MRDRAPHGRRRAVTRARPVAGAVLAALVAAAPLRTPATPLAIGGGGPPGVDDDGGPLANGRRSELAGALAVAVAIEAAAIFALLLAMRRRRRAQAGAARALVEVARLTRAGATREVGRLVAGEIGTPLTSALNNLGAARRLLLRDVLQLDEIGAAMDEAQAAGESVAHALHRLRSLTPATGAADVVGLNDVVREGVRLVASGGGATIAAELSPVPGIRGDQIELLQAILELLLNAIETACTTGRGSVTVRTQCEGDVVELSIEHRGAGLFEPDRSRALSSSAATESLGLDAGLAIARSIVESFGGRISVEPPPHAAHVGSDRVSAMCVRFQRAPAVAPAAQSR